MAIKVIELDIDEALSADTFVSEVALVNMPAIETEFMYFARQKFYKAPDYVAEYACRAIRENEERGNPAGTQVGKIRAQQLCNQSEISLETIKRMKSYLERAAVYNSGNWDDKGTISYGLWGGENALKWVDKVLSSIENQDMAEVGERGGIKESKKAPKSDTPNPDPKGEGTAKGDASSTRGAEVSERVEKILKEKSDDFNERYKDKLGYGVNVGMLKSVYQRGVGAYNTSHSPNVSSAEQWALARVNAFLYIVKEGRPENKKYVGDNDLLPTGHPKSEKMSMEDFDYDVSGLPVYVNYDTGTTYVVSYGFIEVNPSEGEDEFIGRCMGSAIMMAEFPDESQRGAVCYSTYRKRFEMSDEDLEMLNGIADILVQIDNYEDRKGIAMDLINQFEEEGLQYDRVAFLRRSGLKEEDFENLRESENLSITQEYKLLGYIDGNPIFSSPEEAEAWGRENYGCDGHHTHTDDDGNVVYMSCETHDETMMDKGMEMEEMLSNGYYIESMKIVSGEEMLERAKEQFSKVTKEKFYTIVANPNEDSVMDIMGKKFRYVYATAMGPNLIRTSRDFCKRMLGRRQFVFRYEDIMTLNAQLSVEDVDRTIIPRPTGTSPDIFLYKGGANCRHYWLELIFGTDNPNDTDYTKTLINQPDKMRREAEQVLPAAGGSGMMNTKANPARGARTVGFSKSASRVILVDIDGTLFDGYAPNPDVIEYVNEKHRNHRIVILTGRNKAQMATTKNELNKYNIRWDELIMSDRNATQSPEFKRGAVIELLKKNYDIVQAIDDNPATRRYYQTLGINTLSPSQVKLSMVPVGFLQGLPIFDDYQDASDFSYENGCGGITQEMEYMGKKRYQACAYRGEQKMSKISFRADSEKRMLYSPVMVPGILIPRLDEITGEKYFVKFTPETIEKIQRKFMIQKRLDKTNLEHGDTKFKDMVMVESWLVTGKQDKAFELGFATEDIPVGTWMVGYKVLDTPEGDTIWNDYIKSGKVKGLSAEGEFLMKFNQQNVG